MTVANLAPHGPNQRVIDVLEHALARAKTGELQAVAVVALSSTRKAVLAHEAIPSLSATLLGMVFALAQDMAATVIDQGRRRPK